MKLTSAQKRMIERLKEQPLYYGANWDKKLSANKRVVDNLVKKGLVRLVVRKYSHKPAVVLVDDQRYKSVKTHAWHYEIADSV